MNTAMSLKENDVWIEEKYEQAQQAIVEADFEKVKNLVKELTDNGYMFAAQMLLKQWEDAGNADFPLEDEKISSSEN